jgi:hypothetical protein
MGLYPRITRSAGTDELAIEIKASLSELTLPGPLLKRSSGG